LDPNLYGVLGVSQDASPEEIRTRYRDLARKLHPDAAPGDTAAEERFKEVGRAYEVLSDAERRRLYDEFGEMSLHPGFDADAARQSRRGFEFNGGAGGFTGLDDLFGQFFGGHQARPRPARGPDLESGIDIDFETSMRGGTRMLTLKRPQRDGSFAEERLRVEVPAGIATRTRLRLAGKGAPGPAGPGDLYVAITVRPHRVFRREGRDLTLEVPIHFREAALGAEVAIPTLDGRANLRVPAGSRDGARLRLRGKGVPASKGQKAGDLLVTLRIRVPLEPEEAERNAIEALAAFEDGTLRDALFA
jgi:DnaJ-class molecular chaperone